MGRLNARKRLRNQWLNRVDYYQGIIERLKDRDSLTPEEEEYRTQLENFVENNVDTDLNKISWVTGTAAETAQRVELPPDTNILEDTVYQVLVHNDLPGGVNLFVKIKWDDADGNQRLSALTDWQLAEGESTATLVQAALLGNGCVLEVVNKHQVTVDCATYIEIRKV